MFNLKKEIKTIKPDLFTWQSLVRELSKIAWRCRRDLSPDTNGKTLFELAYKNGWIIQAYPSNNITYYVVMT